MKNLKRILASVMAITMLAGNVTVGFTATDDNDATTASNRLKAVGVLKGDDNGNLNLDQAVTRAEAAVIMTRILGQEKSASYVAGMNSFADMNGHWAAGAVEVARTNGLIKGYADGTFRPDTKVTYAQMTTMMVRALGAGEAVEARGNWPMNVMAFASANDLTDDVAASINTPMLRGQVAILTDNTLDAPLWEVSGYNTDGSIDISEVEENKDGSKDSLFTEKLDLVKYVEYQVYTKVTVDNEEYSFEAGIDDNKLAGLDEVADADSEKDTMRTFTFAEGSEQDLVVGQMVDVWVNDDKDVVMVQIAEDSDEELVTFERITDLDYSDKEIEVDNKEYDYNTDVTITINGKPVDTADRFDAAKSVNDTDAFEGTLVLDEDGDVKAINAVEYKEFVIVEEVDFDEDDNTYDFDEDTDDTKDGEDLMVDLDDTVVVMAGTKSNIADIEEGDFLLYAEETVNTKKSVYIKVVDVKVVEGEVEGISKDEYEVDGEDYEEYPNFTNVSVKVDDEVKLFVNDMNEILAFDKVVNGGNAGDYAVITEFYVYEDNEENENLAKIVLFDLASGEYTSKMVFDAEETDEEADANNNNTLDAGEEVLGLLGFYDTTAKMVKDDNGVDGDIDAADLAVEFQTLVGRVVEYDIKSDKVVLYNVDSEEIIEDIESTLGLKTAFDVSIDVDREKFTVNTKNYYVNEDEVAVYQATELDGRELEIERLNYSDLKDSDLRAISMVSFDDDMKEADYVFLPLMVRNEQTDSIDYNGVGGVTNIEVAVKQSLSKTNDDYIGIVTNVRELSGNEAKVTVLTKDGEVNFYANEDEADDMKLKYDDEFVGMLVTFSMDSNEYATEENVDFVAISTLVKRKFVEVSDRNEVEVATNNTTTEKEDAYKDLFVVNANITEVTTITTPAEAEVKATGTITLVTGNLADDDTVTVNGTVFTYKGTVTIPASQFSNAAELEVLVEGVAGFDSTVSGDVISITSNLVGVLGNALTLATSKVAAVTLSAATLENGADEVTEVSTMALAFDDIEAADESDITDIDTDDKNGSNEFDDYVKADNIYYYIVDTDDDGDLDNTGSEQAIAIIVFDENGEEAETK